MMTPQYIKNRFGSKRGLMNAFIYALKLRFGVYRVYEDIKLEDVKRLVFICSGNICRSPLAEYVAKKNDFETISYGLHCRGNDPADPRAVAYAKKNGIDLNQHITQNIKLYEPRKGDLLVGMEPVHATELEVLFGNRVPISLVGLWLDKKKIYIHDPYVSCEAYFDFCESQVVSAVESLISKIKTNS